MKKMIQKIRNIIRKIGKFIDKAIVTPITKMIVILSKKTNKSGKNLENFLSKSTNLIFISLIFAVATFIVIDQKILYYSESSAEVLTNQTVKTVYNEEAYVVEGLPKTVDITLIGNNANLYIAKQSSANEVIVDLTGLKAGTHKVDFRYNQGISSVDYKVNPSYATVIIYNKVSQSTKMNIDILNQDSLDEKMIINKVNVDNDNVIVKGAEYQIKKVAIVKALVDAKNISAQETGIKKLTDVPLKAYDEDGNILEVELVPSKIDVNIDILSPNKELPIKVIPKGEVAFGKAISTIETSETKVTVYGTEEILKNLNYIPVEIDVNGLSDTTEYKLEIEKPVGIKSMSVNSLTVKMTLDTVATKDINNVSIESKNLSSEYKVTALSSEDSAITVNVKGVQSVIQNMTSENINAFIDLKGFTEGEHEVDVNVESTDVRVQSLAKTKKVKIKITKK